MILFDKDNAGNLIADLQPFVKDPCFNESSMKCISSSAGGVVSWILNLYKYMQINEKLKKRGVTPVGFIESPSKKMATKSKKKKKSASKTKFRKFKIHSRKSVVKVNCRLLKRPTIFQEPQECLKEFFPKPHQHKVVLR